MTSLQLSTRLCFSNYVRVLSEGGWRDDDEEMGDGDDDRDMQDALMASFSNTCSASIGEGDLK